MGEVLVLGAFTFPGSEETDLVYAVSVSSDGRIHAVNPFGDRIYVPRFTG